MVSGEPLIVKLEHCSKCHSEIPKGLVAYLNCKKVCQHCFDQRKEERRVKPRRDTWLDKYFKPKV